MEKGYEEEGCRRDVWRQQEAADTHLSTTLDEIFQEARRRQR